MQENSVQFISELSRLKCKLKLRGFPEDKISNRKKVFIPEFHKNCYGGPGKDKVDLRIAIRGSLIQTLQCTLVYFSTPLSCIVTFDLLYSELTNKQGGGMAVAGPKSLGGLENLFGT